MVNLTEENYYQDREWLSNSRFKAFLDCEAKALAVENNEWEDTRDETPLLVGNYLHSYFESPEAHEKFKAENGAKMISSRGVTKGELKKDYKVAQNMIETLETDEIFNLMYHGQSGDNVLKEMIIYGEILGIKVKGKVDSINLTKGYFCDLKTMKSIRRMEWSDEFSKKVPGVAANIIGFKYHVQMGLYQELLRQMTGKIFQPLVIAVSKEEIPDKEIIELGQTWLDEGLHLFENNIEHVHDLITGKNQAKKCGHCNYCRSLKKLDKIVNLDDLIAGIV
ncbi:phage protein [Streptococcus equi subsp. equi]|uniref:PD-(D/E)XK nuclease-like domain-containing protein n=1 Tax=Streptococcus equi TaxID=1336 RepID=UPI000657AFBF|nr:PD-(D/E)XK nuclease-like domain-containing protein [Streptococcus equi]MCD3383626.1 PD-(D/E)XK nuclease-like domain-containing protein [Streptococcus equi subsp. zooepidemicus]CRT10070.1 phage protein [Streptococcus equi subsp. equi]CRT25150.1 phage protein [Streptococcus equi subsp. equi]CRT34800.1 phage protein [Streptococcus equi subsp. equi]